MLAVNHVSMYNSVRLCWVPGHENHEGNEVGDALAKAKAMPRIFASVTLMCGVPVRFCFPSLDHSRWLSLGQTSDSIVCTSSPEAFSFYDGELRVTI